MFKQKHLLFYRTMLWLILSHEIILFILFNKHNLNCYELKVEMNRQTGRESSISNPVINYYLDTYVFIIIFFYIFSFFSNPIQIMVIIIFYHLNWIWIFIEKITNSMKIGIFFFFINTSKSIWYFFPFPKGIIIKCNKK